jgi:hypothetical protein
MMKRSLGLIWKVSTGGGGPALPLPRGRNNGILGGRNHTPLPGGPAVENVPTTKVRFLISSLVHPNPARVLLEMFEHLELEGEVAAETSDGAAPFLVIRIPGLSEPVIVPLDKTRPAIPTGCEPAPRN